MDSPVQPPTENIQASCIICGDQASICCFQCGDVTYCSQECAYTDSYIHQKLCPKVKNFKTPPYPGAVRAIMFRPKGKDPEFIWLSRFNDYSLGNDLVLLLGGMYRPEPYFIHKNVVRNKQHETICGFVLQNYREPRALANENMRVLVETLSERLPSKKHKYPWFGTTIFMALKADTPNEGDELRDFSMQDFRNLCDWLSVYGMDSYFNNNSAWALRTQKMKGVHVRGAGVGKFEFTQVFFPRDYPPSFRDNMENSDPKEDGIEEISSVLDVRLSISKSIGLPLVAISRQLALGANTDPIIKTSDAGTVVVCALPASDGMPGGMPGGLMPLQYGAMYETQDWEEFLLPTKARTDKLDVSLYRQDFKDLLPEHMEALCEFVRHITGWSAKGKGKQVDLQELRNEAKKEHFERYWQLYRAQQGWGSDLPSPYNV